MKGYYHSFETFGTLDGPGIRFIIFLQGCNLKCKYCHNRDTWDYLKNNEINAEELIQKVLRYEKYYRDYPKLTISGGEPLIQQDFIIDVLEKAKKFNIEVAIDTNGMFEIDDKIKKIVELSDIFLVDIKHIDSKKCKDLVGVENNKELKFIDYLIEQNKRIYLRQVIIPGVNDNNEDLEKLKQFLDKRKEKIEKIELLPYHNFGNYKWPKNELVDFEIPSDNKMQYIRDYLGI